MEKCPICERGTLRPGNIQETMFGVNLGEFPALLCSSCKESFTDEQTTKSIEAAAKKKGIWGLGVQTKITQAGNSLAVRIPKKIADYLKLQKGNDAFIHPEEGKLVVEAR